MSLVLRSQRAFSETNGRLPQYANVRSCNCCPYGYHIDLDFVRYCESLANAKPSEEELRRRSRRRSRKSMEFMLGLESLFDQWDNFAREQALPELPNESEQQSPSRNLNNNYHSPLTSTPYGTEQRQRAASAPRHPYGSNGYIRSDSPASSTCSSRRGPENDAAARFPPHRPANSPPETRAFLHDALDEVCSDFERTLERASMKRKPASEPDRSTGVNGVGYYSDPNQPKSFTPTRDYYSDVPDSCVAANKSPRTSYVHTKASALPFQPKLSPAEQQYESYVQATVAANAKSPVEDLLAATPPPPPPRRHLLTAKLSSSSAATGTTTTSTAEGTAPSPSSLSDKATQSCLISPGSATDGASSADPQALFHIRQQMALSLKRMKDLEEQVKTIPEMKTELSQLRDDKHRLQQTVQRKDEELQRARELTRLSLTPSPVASPKYASPVQFQPTRISPIALDSMGSRLRSSPTSSEKQAKAAVLKRDVGTLCARHVTRDVAVGSPVSPEPLTRTVGTNCTRTQSVTEMLYTQTEMEEHTRISIRRHEEERKLQRLRELISVGTQMYVAKRESRDSGVQTAAPKQLPKYSVGVSAKPATRDSHTTCKPDVRAVGSSNDRTTDSLCEKCAANKRTVACNTDLATDEESAKSVSLKLLDMPARSKTFSLGDNEKLNLRRKTTGTQYTPIAVHSAGSQTSLAVVHSVGVQQVPQMQTSSTQSSQSSSSRQTDTRDLVRLCTTQTNTEQISPPVVVAKVAPVPPKPRTTSVGSNTEKRKTADNAVNTGPPAATRHSASNTEAVKKRDIACGDIVKPHISIACADNYCDSCKDAIKNLAKDFSKVEATSPPPARAVDSKIPRPKNLPSPLPVRRTIKRQNTYTITPSPSSSPVAERKPLDSSLQEKPTADEQLDQVDSSAETQRSTTEASSTQTKSKTEHTETQRHSTVTVSEEKHSESKKTTSQTKSTSYDLSQIGEGALLVREETRVSINWSRDNSPAPTPTATPRTPDSSQNGRKSKERDTTPPVKAQSPAPDVSKGARKKTAIPAESSAAATEEQTAQAALQQKLPPAEAEARQKVLPSREMLTALKAINNSLLKKMGSKPISSASLKPFKAIIQQEWFRVSSSDKADPLEVADYLDCFEQLSVPLLEFCVNMVDSNGNTAMHYAVSHANFDVVSVLLDSKVCNVNQLNNAGYTCVMLVSLAKLKTPTHRTVVERLFQMADVNIRARKHRQTALMLAVSHGNFDMVQLLLAAGADINIQDEDGSTALMCAAEHGRSDIVKHLLSQPECDSLIQDVDGSTAFKIAWQAGYREIGLLLYVHEQMMLSKKSNRDEAATTGKPATPTPATASVKTQPSK